MAMMQTIFLRSYFLNAGTRLMVLALAWVFWAAPLFAKEVIPPAPKKYFNDYAGVVSGAVSTELEQRLEQFEKDSSSQIVVAIFQQMQSESSVEDYTFRVKQAWGVGQKGKDNGVVLFVFLDNRKVYIQVGYGLEAVVTDALSKMIIVNEITPRFRAQDYSGGIRAATLALIDAAKGEYKGTGRTAAQQKGGKALPKIWLPFLIIALFIFLSSRNRGRGRVYGAGGWAAGGLGGGGWGGGSGGWGGGGGGSSGGGFSGGGGGGGGGGAGGDW